MKISPLCRLPLVYFCAAAFFGPDLSLAQSDSDSVLEEILPDAELNDPITTAAYGELFDSSGREIDPTPEFLHRTTVLYIGRLLGMADDRTRQEFNDHRNALAKTFGLHELTPRFLLLEWLAEEVAPGDKAHLYAKNRTMRMAWFKGLLGERDSGNW